MRVVRRSRRQSLHPAAVARGSHQLPRVLDADVRVAHKHRPAWMVVMDMERSSRERARLLYMASVGGIESVRQRRVNSVTEERRLCSIVRLQFGPDSCVVLPLLALQLRQ